jgi:S-adenosylmethionine:tRNA ribosyltransferase-isomerase
MQIQNLRYSLIPENLEGTPREIRLGKRDLARLLVVNRSKGTFSHSHVRELPQWLNAGDVLVLNNSKRIPGVLRGFTDSNGQVELRFVDLGDDEAGLCRVFPMHDVRPGSRVRLRDGGCVDILEMGLTKYNLARVRSAPPSSLRDLLRTQGIPILGFFYEGLWGTDHLNPYYASVEGSVESPLAGLHFTPELVARIKAAGINVCFVTLHSVGSWLPFLEENVEDHEMWAEKFCVPKETAVAVSEARSNGKRVFACGSTSLRAIESAARDDGRVEPMEGKTSLYITPNYRFKATEGYFTNFHQYQTSLIVLDAAFGGTDLVKKAYRDASKRRYSFYEFGDAVLYL